MRGVRLPSLIEPVSAGHDQQWSYRPDEVSHSLGHSHNGQVQVCPDRIGHYRCVDDPQTVDAVHLAVLVNNCIAHRFPRRMVRSRSTCEDLLKGAPPGPIRPTPTQRLCSRTRYAYLPDFPTQLVSSPAPAAVPSLRHRALVPPPADVFLRLRPRTSP